MDWGMKNRLARLIQPDGRCMFLPIDHGYFQGPTSRLEKPGETIAPLIQFADGLFVTRGVLRACVQPDNSPPLILRVSGGSSVIGKDLAHLPTRGGVEGIGLGPIDDDLENLAISADLQKINHRFSPEH